MSKSSLYNLKFNLAIIDDHDCILQGASTYLKKTFVNANILTFTEGNDFLNHLKTRDFDICIVDLELQDTEGLKIIKYLKGQRPDIKIIVYTMHDEPWIIRAVLEQNVEGIVMKNSPLEMLKKSIEEVFGGEKFYCQKMKHIKQDHKDGAGGSYILWETFNETDRQIVILMAKSLTSEQIALKTGHTKQTIMSYKRDIYRKFQVKSAAELIAKAIAYGFVDKKELLRFIFQAILIFNCIIVPFPIAEVISIFP